MTNMSQIVLNEGRSVGVFVGMFGMTYIVMKWMTRRATTVGQGEHRHPHCLRSIPVVGSIPFMPQYQHMHTRFMAMTEQMGNVIAMYIGSKYTVVLNGFEAMQEALSKRSVDFASRPDFYVTHELLNPNWKGIIDRPYDSSFKKNHQLALTILKDFGFGQTIMEDRIRFEVEELVDAVRLTGGESVYPRDLVTKKVLNVIASIMFGARFTPDDPHFDKLVSVIHAFVSDSMELAGLNMFPPLRVFPSVQRSIKKVKNSMETMFDIIKEKLKEAAGSGKNETSFAASFMSAEGSENDEEELLYTMRDLLLAGTETSATTLQWALILLANNPHVQKRIQHEIDSVVPRDRLPSLSDKVNLPYVEATICEVYRRWSIVPMGAPRETLCDTEVEGYFIPKGTIVFANIYSCHMNPKDWVDPELFNPERFLDSDSKLILRDRVVSFSMGKRSCLGEVLARQEVYLFFTGLLQNFDILPQVGHDKVEFRVHYGGTIVPADYKLRLVPRPIV